MSILDAWDYDLPEDRIASRPAERRDASRLLVLPRGGGPLEHDVFSSLPVRLRPGDRIVANDTRVLAARLFARRSTGGRVELLVLEVGQGAVRALARPARKLRVDEVLSLEGGGSVTVAGPGHAAGEVLIRFDADVIDVLERQGSMPLPPYLGRDADASDRERYQTVYAGPPGAAAAPTAGLHFTEQVLAELAQRDIGFSTVTLHVGIGTFRPLTEQDVVRGTLHEERWFVPETTAAEIAETRAAGGRIIAVGTTSARTLESATPMGSRVPEAGEGYTDLFIQPPYTFRGIDGLITNFHLPRSSLLMLVASLCDRERLMGAYAQAIERGYRFYSYGDAMLLL